MAVTPNLGLPVMESGQAQKHVPFNDSMAIIDGLLGSKVVDLDLSSATVAAAMFPERCVLYGASWRVLETITFSGGGLTFSVQEDVNSTVFSSGLSPLSGGILAGPVSPFALFSSAGLEIIPDAGAITGGVIRLKSHYLLLPVPAADL